MSGAPAAGAVRLSARNVAVARGGRTLAGNISFVLETGAALVVTGPNGAGKSTLLRVLAGLLPASGGEVAFETGDTERWPGLGPACHFLGAGNAMKSALTVAENLDFWQRYGGEPAGPLEDALAAVGLVQTSDMPFGWLSTGQKRRVAIARLLLNFRPVWMLDEPTSGLDTAAAAALSGLMESHRAAGGIVIAATHMPLGLAGAHTLEIGGSP